MFCSSRYELGDGADEERLKCPRNWVRFKSSCYKFTRSPIKVWEDAKALCQAFRHDDTDHADLASVDSYEEHRFIKNYLNEYDPQHRRWYISTRQDSPDKWINADGKQMTNLEAFFVEADDWGQASDYKKDFLAYHFDLKSRDWGFLPVFGHEEYLYICEVPIEVRTERSARL